MRWLLALCLIVGIVGCAPVVQQRDQVARIVWVCHGCFSGQPVGYAPIAVTVFAEQPDGARYVWAFGDGSAAEGRFVTHTYTQPGLYRVDLVATVKRGMVERRYFASTYFKVLALPTQAVAEQTVETELFAATIVFPKRLALGESGSVCVHATAKQDLMVLSLRLVEAMSLVGEGEFEPLWLYIPAGRFVEHCVVVKRIGSAGAWVEFTLFGATDRVGAEHSGRVTFEGLAAN